MFINNNNMGCLIVLIGVV
jgi:NADH-quinone oxidoreductase subunit H